MKDKKKHKFILNIFIVLLIVFVTIYLPKISAKLTNNIIFKLIILLLIACVATKEPLFGIVLFFIYAFSLKYNSRQLEKFNSYIISPPKSENLIKVGNDIIGSKYCVSKHDSKQGMNGTCSSPYQEASNDPAWCCIANADETCNCVQYCAPVTCVPKGTDLYGGSKMCPTGFNESVDDPSQCCVGDDCHCKPKCTENSKCLPSYPEEEEQVYPCCAPCVPCPEAEGEEESAEMPCECICLPNDPKHKHPIIPGVPTPIPKFNIVQPNPSEAIHDPAVKRMAEVVRFRENPYPYQNTLDTYTRLSN